MKKSKKWIWLVIFLIISVACNGLQYVYHRFWKENMSLPGIVHFKNANSRETYFTLHNIKAAWKYGCGRGVKIGVIDWLFGLEQYPELYAGGVDFAANPKALNNQAEHGKWMATVLREVAPDCAIYALSIAMNQKEERKVDSMIQAIDWAIEHDLDVLTYSSAPFSAANTARLDQAIARADAVGIVTTFIHYYHPTNLLPGVLGWGANPDDQRPSDIQIFGYDYNTTMAYQYHRYLNAGVQPRSGDEMPYFSYSSTSPVAAGFVAILMSVKPGLAPAEYKAALTQNLTYREFADPITGREIKDERAADIGKAASWLATGVGD